MLNAPKYFRYIVVKILILIHIIIDLVCGV